MAEIKIQPAEISQLEYAFPATVKHLMPPQSEIPDEFKRRNKRTDFCDEWFFKGADPKRLTEKDGIDRVKAIRHVASIMGSFEPKHEHKISASAYLLSLWFDLDTGAERAEASNTERDVSATAQSSTN